MEEFRNFKSQEKKGLSSMRTSPIYIECRCREIEEIKKNLSVAVETIHSLRQENTKIKEMLQIEYQEKLSSLQNECVYLKFKLKQSQKNEAAKSVVKELEKLKTLCKEKEKVIEIQEKKLNDIGNSVKRQVKEFKSVVEYSKSLESDLAKVKNLDKQGFFPVFYEFYKFSKSLSEKVLYQTVKNSLGSLKEVFKDIEKNNCVKILKNLLSLATELLRCLELNRALRVPIPKKQFLQAEERTHTKTSNSTNFAEENINLTDYKEDSKEDSLKAASLCSPSLKPSQRTKLVTKDLARPGLKLNKTEEISSVSGHSKQSSMNKSDCVMSNLKGNCVSSLKGAGSPVTSKSLTKIPEVQSVNKSDREDIERIEEEVPLYPKDYSSLFKEGEQLLELIDNQNSRLSRLSKEISGAYHPEAAEVSQEISSGGSEHAEEFKPNSEVITRKRSRWNTNNAPDISFNPFPNNLRIPESGQEAIEKPIKSRIPSRNANKGERSSPSSNRFAGYIRPNLKKEENWESVEEFFNSD